MTTVEESIDVKVPVRTAYNQWTQFEEFPKFMGGVQAVTQLADDKLHWVAEIAGQRREWDAQIAEQKPDDRIAWTSTSGTGNAGVVTFHRIDDNTTRVMLQLEMYPDDWKEKAAEMTGMVKRQAKKDLERFKEFIESRGRETGAWRGEIDQRRAG
ncbi:MAG TPA: SRPBCC family protein [Actinomycetota bacterium]|nr:SRPBCC family protein [Actinomycetota bacterium]